MGAFIEDSTTFLFFVNVLFTPWILLVISCFLFGMGIAQSSWKKMAVGFIVFLPNLICLLLLELEPLLYVTVLLPVFQLGLGIQYYRFERFVKSEMEDMKKRAC